MSRLYNTLPLQARYREREATWWGIAGASKYVDKEGAKNEELDDEAGSTTSAAERRANKNQCVAALRVIREGCIKQANGLSMLIDVSTGRPGLPGTVQFLIV